MSGGRFLARWSRLKRGEVAAPAATPAVVPEAAQAVKADAAPPETAPAADEALPPPDTLTLDSDFTAYLKAEVGEAVRRQALKKLFNDPHFNVMDGLDVYIDDYSVSAPIPPDVLARLRHAQALLTDHDAPAAEQSETEVAAASGGVEAADDGAGEVEGGGEADGDAPETVAAHGPVSHNGRVDKL